MTPEQTFDRVPLMVGTLALTVRNGRNQVVSRHVLQNTIQLGAKLVVPYALGYNNSQSDAKGCGAIDYYDNVAEKWQSGTILKQAYTSGTLDSTRVVHTNSYTCVGLGNRLITGMRIRRATVAATSNGLAASQEISQVGVSIGMSADWKIDTTWTLYM